MRTPEQGSKFYETFTKKEEEKLLIDVVEANESSYYLHVARKSVTESYNQFSPHLNAETVYQMICNDRYGKKDESSTLVALTHNQKTGKKDFTGTLRFAFGKGDRDPDLKPIEAMSLFSPPEGWPQWTAGFSENQLGEFGRFAIARPYRRQSSQILKALTQKGFAIAQEKRIQQIYAIMPENILRLYEKEGILPEHIPGATLREDDPNAQETFTNFPSYWRRKSHPPKLYRFSSKHIYGT